MISCICALLAYEMVNRSYLATISKADKVYMYLLAYAMVNRFCLATLSIADNCIRIFVGLHNGQYSYV